MRLLFLGDIVGDEALGRVETRLPSLRRELDLQAVVANAENAAGGSGLNAGQYHRLRAAGVDVVSLGDHGLKRREIVPLMAQGFPICRPANQGLHCPGRPFISVVLASGVRLQVISVLGRAFMKPTNCPFDALDQALEAMELEAGPRVVLADLHAEATAEKELLGWFLDGRVAAALGTHTHVPTADERILPGGTAYQTDVGMCGSLAGVLGRDPEAVLRTTRTGLPESWPLCRGRIALQGALVELDESTGRARSISRFLEELRPT